MRAFKVGQTYETRSACDHNCIFSYEVIRRTAKRITFMRHGHEVTRGVKPNWDGDAEMCYPEGVYSMCPVINA